MNAQGATMEGAFPVGVGLYASKALSWIALLASVAIGFAIRVYRYDDLSLWLDEMYVIEYQKLSWSELLGLHGTYDNHPPLYFLLVKAVSLLTNDLNAARILSIATGTATIAAVYLLMLRLANRPAAFVASLILATSPLHIWYSQEGRMYAPAVLAVTLSYYALIRLLDTQTTRWTVLYALTLVLSIYMEYSAIYALVPHVAIVGYVARKQGLKTARRWAAAGIGAALCFAPWIVRLLDSIDFVGDDRRFLLVTRGKIVDSFFTITGLPGSENYYWGAVQTPWVRWPEIRPASAALVVAILVFSAVTLNGRHRFTFVVGATILLGTIVTAAMLSYAISPGYADRTVIYAVVGWAVLAGATPFGRVPNGGRRMSLAATGALLTLSLLAVWSIREDGSKEHYRDLAMLTGQAATFDIPVLSDQRPPEPLIADSTGLITTALSAYGEQVTTLPVSDTGNYPAFWHVYTDFPWEVEGIDRIQAEFAAKGYTRVLSHWFEPVHFLDLYLLPGATIGHRVDIPPIVPATASQRPSLPRWTIEDVSLRIDEHQVVSTFGTSDGEHFAYLEIPAASQTLYLVSIESRFNVSVGSATTTLYCQAGRDALPGASHIDHPADEEDHAAWHASTVAIMCPAGTTSLGIELQANGATEVQFRNLRVSELAQGEPVRHLERPAVMEGRPGVVES